MMISTGMLHHPSKIEVLKEKQQRVKNLQSAKAKETFKKLKSKRKK